MYFIKDTLVYEAQLPLNILAEPLAVNSPWLWHNRKVCLCLVLTPMNAPGRPGDGMMPPRGSLHGGEEGMRIFEDNITWYKFSLQGAVMP